MYVAPTDVLYVRWNREISDFFVDFRLLWGGDREGAPPKKNSPSASWHAFEELPSCSSRTGSMYVLSYIPTGIEPVPWFLFSQAFDGTLLLPSWATITYQYQELYIFSLDVTQHNKKDKFVLQPPQGEANLYRAYQRLPVLYWYKYSTVQFWKQRSLLIKPV